MLFVAASAAIGCRAEKPVSQLYPEQSLTNNREYYDFAMSFSRKAHKYYSELLRSYFILTILSLYC